MKTRLFPTLLLAVLSTVVQQFTTLPARAQSAPFNNLGQATGTVTVVSGFIVAVTLVGGGAGYPGPPVVSVVDPTGSNVVITAAISSNGVVTNLTVSSAGNHYSAAPTLVIAPPPTNTSQNDINVIISPRVTDNIRTWTSGTNYPNGGFYTNYAGISFYFAGFPGITNGLGIVDTGTGSLTAPVTNNFPVNITNAVMVYTLMNSDTGEAGFTNGALEFYGSQGAQAAFYLVEGLNIRDHYNGGYANTISSNIMSHYWGAGNNVRLDCQGWMLPASFFAQTLTNIQVLSYGKTPNGVAVVAAITVRTGGPAVTVSRVGNQEVCRWPSTPTNYVLQSTASLNNPVWLTVTNSPVVSSNQFAVTSVLTITNQFYRLLSVP